MSFVELRDMLVVDGPDAARYLQGQLSNETAELAVGASNWSLLLEPSGKLGFLVRVRREGPERFQLDLDAGTGEAVESRLRRFLIRTKVTLERGELFVDHLPTAADSELLLGWWGETDHAVVAGPASPVSQLAARRVAAGWPAAGHELVDGVVPAESGLVPFAVSFTKGCYTGQELVARIDSRGNNVVHHLRAVALGAPAVDGEPIVVGDEEVGRLTTVAGEQALGYVHRKVDPTAEVLVGGIPAVLAALPTRG